MMPEERVRKVYIMQNAHAIMALSFQTTQQQQNGKPVQFYYYYSVAGLHTEMHHTVRFHFLLII